MQAKAILIFSLSILSVSAQISNEDSSFDKVDTNSDGAVNDAELLVFLKKLGRRDSREMLARFDLNHDKTLDISEFVPLVYEAGRHPVDIAYQFFKKMDKNDDGVVDRSEVAQSRKDSDGSIIDGLLAIADVNNDGQLSYDEFKSQLSDGTSRVDQERQNAQRLLSFMDTNGDNRIDQREMLVFAAKSPTPQSADETLRAFRLVDANGDGFLHIDELLRLSIPAFSRMTLSPPRL